MKIIKQVPVSQDITVDVVESYLEVAYANQYDDNTSTIHCHIQNKGVDFTVENYTVTLRVKKSNGKGFSANIGSRELEGAVQGNVVSFRVPKSLTISHGKQICNLEFFEKEHVENGIKYSCTFYLRVNESALKEEDILDSDCYASVHDEYIKLKTDMRNALLTEQERATSAENTISDNLAVHSANEDNPHGVTKTQLGLGNVEDKSSAAIRAEMTKENVTSALGYTPYTPNEVDDKCFSLETNKVDKIAGMGLSANNFTDDYKSALDNISGGMVTGIKGSAENEYRTGNVSLTKENIGLANVGNFKAVSTSASQGLSSTEKANARANIGAGTSSFSGSYNDLSNKPSIPAAVTVNNNLTSDSTTAALSAAQGKELKRLVDGKQAAGSYASSAHTHHPSPTSKAATTVSLASSTTESTLDSVTLSAGTWLIKGSAEFASNSSSGQKYITLRQSSTSGTKLGKACITCPYATTLEASGFVKLTSNTTIYLRGYQNCGSALSTTAQLTYMKLDV